jgi:predicted transport protein
MALFSIDKENVKKISSNSFTKEKSIQVLFEKNLIEILNITFLATEYPTSFGGRMDTLGIDKNGSPVIIEYKLNQNDNIINQGLSYLHWLLDHKAEFKALIDEANLEIEIDWASPRVICVAESYNKFDLDTADLLPIDIELLKYQLYGDNVLFVDSATQRKVRIPTSKVFNKAEKQKQVFKEKIHYIVEDHLESTTDDIRELFNELKERIISLDEAIIEEAKSRYIAYKLTTNFVDVLILKNSLKLFLNIPSGQLNDPQGIARDLANPKPIGHWGNGDYEVKFENKEDIDIVMDLIKQSYNHNK